MHVVAYCIKINHMLPAWVIEEFNTRGILKIYHFLILDPLLNKRTQLHLKIAQTGLSTLPINLRYLLNIFTWLYRSESLCLHTRDRKLSIPCAFRLFTF